MRNLLKRADMLVTPYEFNVNQRQKSLTVIGGVLSILVGIFSIVYMIGVIQKALSDQDTIYVGTQSTNYNQSYINSNNTIFAFEISDQNGNIFENISEIEQYINVNVQYIEQKRDASKIGFERNSSNLLLKRCETTTVDKFNFDVITISNSQKQNLYCADGIYSLTGQYFDSYFSYLKIQVKVCKNTTNIYCKTLDEIQSFIKSGINVDLFVQGSRLRQQFNLSSPIEAYPTNIFWKLALGMSNNEDVFIMPFSMDLKSNSIFYDLMNIKLEEKLFQTTTFQKQERRLEPVEFTEGSTLCSFFIRSSVDNQYFFITQSDLFTIISSSLSEATALAVAIMSFLKIFYHSYNQHQTFAILMNSVFKFDLESVKKKRQSSIYQSDQSGAVFQQKASATPIKTGQLQQILNFEISYSFIQYIKYLIYRLFRSIQGYNFFKTEKEIIISQIAKSKIQYDLDLTNILKKLYEIDCLKLFFFDDDQLILFNTFCSPVFQDGMVNQKDLFDILTNQQQQQKKLSNSQLSEKDKRLDLTFVASSEIPINVRLAKVARFFKAQLGASNAEGLVRTFQRINENLNQNSTMNQKLLSFTKQNSSLFRLVQSQYESNLQKQAFNQVPDEIDSQDKQNSGGKDSAWSIEIQSCQLESEKRQKEIEVSNQQQDVETIKQQKNQNQYQIIASQLKIIINIQIPYGVLVQLRDDKENPFQFFESSIIKYFLTNQQHKYLIVSKQILLKLNTRYLIIGDLNFYDTKNDGKQLALRLHYFIKSFYEIRCLMHKIKIRKNYLEKCIQIRYFQKWRKFKCDQKITETLTDDFSEQAFIFYVRDNEKIFFLKRIVLQGIIDINLNLIQQAVPKQHQNLESTIYYQKVDNKKPQVNAGKNQVNISINEGQCLKKAFIKVSYNFDVLAYSKVYQLIFP